MSNDIGKVVFEDGTTLYPVVQGTVGFVYRKLYTDAHAAFDARYEAQSVEVPDHVPDEEVVAV